MKISKRSWHYRLLKYFSPDKELAGGELKPTSLCAYTAQLLFLCLLGLPAMALMFAVLAPVIYPMIKLDEWAERHKAARAGLPPREPRTLAGKWLRAKKEKVCPLLEWDE